MSTNIYSDQEERQALEQGGSFAEPPPAPPPVTPSAPPSDGIVARLQRMSPAGRWALGLGLAFASGLAWALATTNLQLVINGLVVLLVLYPIVCCALALAASFTLSSWGATPALLAASLAGGLLISWLTSLPYGGLQTGSFGVYLALAGPQLIVFLLVGTALARRRGLTLGRPHALSGMEALASLWIVAIGPALVGAFLAGIGYVVGAVSAGVLGVMLMIAFALTCLVGAWVARSWLGFLVVPLAYLVNATLVVMILNAMGGGPGSALFRGIGQIEYVLYLVLPAVAMSAIGTAIGMYRGGQRSQRPRYGQLAT